MYVYAFQSLISIYSNTLAYKRNSQFLIGPRFVVKGQELQCFLEVNTNLSKSAKLCHDILPSKSKIAFSEI